jgi:ribosomal protein L11 methyltransferase
MTGPYRTLYIYEVEGLLHNIPEEWAESNFLGCWYEGEFSFLFFATSQEKTVRQYLKQLPNVRLRTAVELPFEDWEAGQPLKPFRVGSLWVSPPWETDGVKASDRLLVIDPGVSFGSGYHPSTRACLELLVEVYSRDLPERVLDLGTGSGILALAAARLGARRVLAVDLQPVAIATAKRNVRYNGLCDLVEVRLGEAYEYLAQPSDLLVANLTYDLLQALLGCKALYTRSWYIFSGLVGKQVEQFREAVAQTSLRIVELRQKEAWSAVLLRGKRSRKKP